MASLQRPTSIEDQLVVCRQAAARWGYEVDERHIYTDQELSGTLSQRPGYQQLLAAARATAFAAIVVEAQDRLWRDQAEMHGALRRLRFWGVRVLSVETGADLTDKTGAIIASVMGWRDEMYLASLREKTHRGLAGQARRGFSAGGRAYGYRTEPVGDPTRVDPHGQPVVTGYRRAVHAAEAEVVRRIFAMFAAGVTPREIAHMLNAEGMPPPRGTKGWTWTAMYGSPRLGTGILNNPLYVGQTVWNRFRWEQDPDTGRRVPRARPRDEWVVQNAEELRIVPQELWDRVKARQAEIAAKSAGQKHAGGRPPKYLFSGLLVCGECGGHFVLRARSYYACSFHVNRGPAICANGRVVHRRVVEAVLVEAIKRDLFRPEAVAYLTQRMNALLHERLKRHGLPRLTGSVWNRSCTRRWPNWTASGRPSDAA